MRGIRSASPKCTGLQQPATLGHPRAHRSMMTQTARSLATAANVVRAIDAVTAKPETGSTLTIVTTALKQVATIQTNIPNVYLEQQAFNTTIENDLRLAINDGLDKLILDAIATSGFQAPGTDVLLVSIRKAITTIQGSGSSPDTLLLPPASMEALDTLRATATAGEQYFVLPPPSWRRATSSAWRCGSRRRCPPPPWSTRRRSESCTPPR